MDCYSFRLNHPSIPLRLQNQRLWTLGKVWPVPHVNVFYPSQISENFFSFNQVKFLFISFNLSIYKTQGNENFRVITRSKLFIWLAERYYKRKSYFIVPWRGLFRQLKNVGNTHSSYIIYIEGQIRMNMGALSSTCFVALQPWWFNYQIDLLMLCL